jgi:hypothetical protein
MTIYLNESEVWLLTGSPHRTAKIRRDTRLNKLQKELLRKEIYYKFA